MGGGKDLEVPGWGVVNVFFNILQALGMLLLTWVSDVDIVTASCPRACCSKSVADLKVSEDSSFEQPLCNSEESTRETPKSRDF